MPLVIGRWEERPDTAARGLEEAVEQAGGAATAGCPDEAAELMKKGKLDLESPVPTRETGVVPKFFATSLGIVRLTVWGGGRTRRECLTLS